MPFLDSIASRSGWLLYALLGAAVPLLVVPVSAWPWFHTDRSAQVAVKTLAMIVLCGAVCIAAAASLAGGGARRYGARTLVPGIGIALFALWGLVSAWFAPVRGYALNEWLMNGLGATAALAAPLFLNRAWRVRAVLLACIGAAVVACTLGVVGSLGYRGFNRWVYGKDPREVIEAVVPGEKKQSVEGGAQRSGSISTLSNPEYAGSYAGILAAVAAVMLLDWASAARRRALWRMAALGALGILLLELAFSGSRQPWLALMLAGYVRLAWWAGWPMKRVAMVALAALAALPLAGAKPAALVFAAGALAVAGLHSRGMAERWRATAPFNRMLVAGGPLLLLAAFINFSVPSPLNPTGQRLAQRFLSAKAKDDESFRLRVIFFMLAGGMVREAPLLGKGPGHYANAFRDVFSRMAAEDESGLVLATREGMTARVPEQTHNDYLQIASEQGIPALLFFLTGMLGLLYGLHRIAMEDGGAMRLAALAAAAGLIASMSVMLSSFPLQMPERASVFWTLCAAAMGLLARQEED